MTIGIGSERPPPSMRSRLFEAQSLLEAVIDGTPDAIWVVSRDDRIVLCNAAAMALLEREGEQVVDRTVAEVFPAAMAQMIAQGSKEVATTSAPTTSEAQLVRTSGEVRTLLTLLVPHRDSYGTTVAVVAIARDITDRRRHEDALRKYLDAIVRVRDEERRLIARELHDEAGQALTSMLVRLRALERDPRVRDDETLRAKLADVVGVGEGLHDELSRLARGLHPGVLENLGLEAALSHLAAQARKSGLAVELSVRAGPRLAAPVELAAYRIVQESTTNVVKHARARALRIEADWTQDVLAVNVQDDGVGFSADVTSETGIGLLGIRERVRHLKGQLDIESGDGGTRLRVVIPIASAP